MARQTITTGQGQKRKKRGLLWAYGSCAKESKQRELKGTKQIEFVGECMRAKAKESEHEQG